MAKKLLSPELNQVLKDIESAREAINEKHEFNGHPDLIAYPLLSGDLASRIKDIFVINTNDADARPEDVLKGKVFYAREQRLTGNMRDLSDGVIELSYDHKREVLPSGYYGSDIVIELKDYAVSFVFNRQGLYAKTIHVNINESFDIPDFEVNECDGEVLIGWTHIPDSETPEYVTGDTINDFEFKQNLNDSSYISYLYGIWKPTYTYKVFCYGIHGEDAEPEVYPYGPTIEESYTFVLGTDIPTPERDGYKFCGWTNSPDSEDIITENIPLLCSEPEISIYALWKELYTYRLDIVYLILNPSSNNVELFSDSKEFGPTTDTSCDIDLDDITAEYISNLEAYGYSFKGWGYYNGSTNILDLLTLGPEDKIFDIGLRPSRLSETIGGIYEQLTLNTFILNYVYICPDSNYCIGNNNYVSDHKEFPTYDPDYPIDVQATLSEKTEEVEEAIAHCSNIIRFVGWGKGGKSSIGALTENNIITERILLEAPNLELDVCAIYRELITCSITYKNYDGEIIYERDLPVVSIMKDNEPGAWMINANYTPNIEREGYTFKGWSEDENSGNIVETTSLKPPNNERVLYAVWGEPTLYNYKVVFFYYADKGTIKNRSFIGYTDYKNTPKDECRGNLTDRFNDIMSDVPELIIPNIDGYNFLGWRSYPITSDIENMLLNDTLSDDYKRESLCNIISVNDMLAFDPTYVTEEFVLNPLNPVELFCAVYSKQVPDPVDPDPVDPDPVDPSNYYNISEVGDYTDQWGYVELGKHPSKGKALQELYTRIYNSYINNGEKPVISTALDGSKITQDALFDASNIDATPELQAELMEYNGLLCISVEDLNLNYNDVARVQNIVEYDCPGVLNQWYIYIDPDLGNDTCVTYHLMYHFDTPTREEYLSTMESTFQEICDIIKEYYGIIYTKNTFNKNNKKYSKIEKKRITKVIHDYIVTHNHYGDNSMNPLGPPWDEMGNVMLNQIAYPALSKGKYDPICASYAKGFKYCCDKWGISCLIVAGHVGNEQDGNHEWNMVSYEQLTPKECGMTESYWQEVDCTHDDYSKRTILNEYVEYGVTEQTWDNVCSWDHFNVTTSELNNGIMTKGVDLGPIVIDPQKGAARFKDTYQEANQENGTNPDGSQEIGVYLTYPDGTCDTNKYNGNETYGGF